MTTHFINTQALEKLTKEQLVDLIELTNNELRKRIVGENVKAAEPAETPFSKRKQAIGSAKAAIETLKTSPTKEHYVVKGYFACYAEFHVNKDKQAVTVLLKGYQSKKVLARGIAKCDPTDVFNVHIGKAIALYRALGIKVPELLLTAEHDGKVEIGDIVEWEGRKYKIIPSGESIYAKQGELKRAQRGSGVYKNGKVIDDSKE